MTKYCIIDDEPIAHRILEGYCSHLSTLIKVGNCYDAFQAMELFSKHHIDLIFLDLNMPKLSGFDLLKTLQFKPIVIVTSAHKEYALEGYELSVLDYLLKPFSFDRFLKAVNKFIGPKFLKVIPPTSPPNLSTSLFIKGDKKVHQLHFDDILFVEACGNYSKVYLKTEMILCHEKISAIEDLLPAHYFLRVHKSFIIARDKIKVVEGNRIYIQDQKIPIGQTYKNDLKKILNSA